VCAWLVKKRARGLHNTTGLNPTVEVPSASCIANITWKNPARQMRHKKNQKKPKNARKMDHLL
jgi:hypothetical protein